MLYSIVVPIYKVEKYLDRCVESLIGQTYRDIEIILVDDGSPDRCPIICDKYAAIDSRIIVIHKENGGLSDARNAGIDVATGDYIMFVDSDDYIDTDTCQRMLPFVSEGYDLVVADARVDRDGKPGRIDHDPALVGKPLVGREFLKRSLGSAKAPMAAVLNLYKREYLNRNGFRFKKGILHEDERFTPDVFLSAERVIYSGETFYTYIIRDESITTSKDFRRNATDLYATCLELRHTYANIKDGVLRRRLLDSLVTKYLYIFQVGRLYAYGKEYLHRGFVLRNAKRPRTVVKALLFAVSPRLYYRINKRVKESK